MADDPKPTVAQQTIRLMRSKDFRVAFANTFRIRSSPADIGIAFGYQTELPSGTPGGPDQALIVDEVEVVLTPMALKLLQLALNDNIEAIEAATGKPVELPQNILDTLAEQKAKAKAALSSQVESSTKT